MTRSTVAAGSGGMREGRVLSRLSPSTPSCMKRSCQRQTTVLPLPTARAMALVPAPSAVRTMIRARQTCFCGLLRLPMIVSSRTRSSAVTVMEIPLRITDTRTKPNLQKPHSDSSVRRYPLASALTYGGRMEYRAISFLQKFGLFHEQWQPKVIAEMNDYQFKVVKLQGDFIWHDHEDTDETFIVIEGDLRIDFRDGALHVRERGQVAPDRAARRAQY